MPYRNRRFRPRRRRFARRKRPAYKGLRMLVPKYRVNRTLVHAFKRNVIMSPIVTTTTGTYVGGYSFALANLPNFSDFSGLYDYYRLNMVIMRIIYRGSNLSSMESANNAALGLPYMYYVIDRDDATTPATVDEVREYAAAKMHIFTGEKRACYIKLRPSLLTETYKSALSTSYQVKRASWLDLADSGNTPHYGIKLAIIVPVNSTQAYASQDFDVEVKYYFQMKNPR